MVNDMVNSLYRQLNKPDINAVAREMGSLQQGGNVDLFNRPQISTNELRNVGWQDAGDGTATVYSSTYTDRTGNRAGNFTPIMTDMAGSYVGTMSEPELTRYAEGVMEGNPDVYGLRIGQVTDLDSALANAEKVHQLQEAYYNALNEMLKMRRK